MLIWRCITERVLVILYNAGILHGIDLGDEIPEPGSVILEVAGVVILPLLILLVASHSTPAELRISTPISAHATNGIASEVIIACFLWQRGVGYSDSNVST